MSAIDKVEKSKQSKLSQEQLDHLNAALYLSWWRRSEVRLAQAQLEIAQLRAEKADREIHEALSKVSDEMGVALGKTHDWKLGTGELIEVATSAEPQ